MSTVYSRARAEAELVHALTRQIGYTTGAFSILRMARLIDIFKKHTAYQFEVVKQLKEEGLGDAKLSEKYAQEILNFSGELGLFHRLQGASAPHLSRLTLSDAGVAIRAAHSTKSELEHLVLEHLILEADADAYMTVLQVLGNSKVNESPDDLNERFRGSIQRMRVKRLSWLREAFPNNAVLLRIVKAGAHQVHWLQADRFGKIGVDVPGADFGRHHFTPRKSWAVELGHYDPVCGALTAAGRTFESRTAYPESGAGWIAPPVGCVEFLRPGVAPSLEGPCAPTLDLLRPQGNTENPPNGLVDDLASFMVASFPAVKLIHARQAPIAAARYFLILQENQYGVRFDLEECLRAVARIEVKRFAFFSSRTGALAYYQVRDIDG